MKRHATLYRQLHTAREPSFPTRATRHAIVALALAATTLSGCVSLRPWNEVASTLGPDRFVTVDGQPVSVEQVGSGAPVVLLHGFGESTYSFTAVMPALSRNFRVVAIDLNGFGFTRRPTERDAYTLAGQRRLVIGVLDALGLDRVRLVGHSYGGAIALDLSSLHPERVDRLLLIDNAMPSYAAERRSALFGWRWLTSLLVRTVGLSDRRIASGLEAAYFDDTKVTPELVRAYADRLRIEGAADAYRGLVGPSEEPRREVDVSTVKVPTLVIWGEEDRLIQVGAARETARGFPAARFVAIPACGHTPMEECPEAFLEAALPFLLGAN